MVSTTIKYKFQPSSECEHALVYVIDVPVLFIWIHPIVLPYHVSQVEDVIDGPLEDADLAHAFPALKELRMS